MVAIKHCGAAWDAVPALMVEYIDKGLSSVNLSVGICRYVKK
jgi:hypothetical protein